MPRTSTFSRATCLLTFALLSAFERDARAASIHFLISDTPPPPPGENVLLFGGMPGDPLFGVNIGVDFVVGDGTPLRDGVGFSCIACRLDFSTGPFIGGDTETWLFAGGGGLTLMGFLDLNGDLVPDVPFAFGGFFAGPAVVGDEEPAAGLVSGFALAAILDIKHPVLMALYGLPDTLYQGTVALDIVGSGDAPGGFGTQVQGGVVTNSPVSEPGVLVLFASGFAAFVALRRRGA